MANFLSNYYHKEMRQFFKQIVPLNSKSKVINHTHFSGKYDYLLLPNTLSNIDDIQIFIKKLKIHCGNNSKVVVVYFNFLWKPFLELGSFLRLKKRDPKEPNWLSANDVQNLFFLEEFEEIKRGKRLLFPIPLGLVSTFINRFLAQLPIFNIFCINTYQIFKPITKPNDYSVSIIVPARNEEGTIKNLLKKIPIMGKNTEVIFVEGKSSDQTYKTIQQEIKHNTTQIKASLYKQKGVGKANAVHLGLSKAKNDIIMILDADLTVPPYELPKFYQALSNGKCEFANGSRLIYPAEPLAMRTLNYLGNKIFSVLFTFLLGQHIKDTLCGTKAFFRSDYNRFRKYHKIFGIIDPFGDFYLLFSANKFNLKIIEIPIRYKERIYGNTNINRFKHGLMLFKMTFHAAMKIKFI